LNIPVVTEAPFSPITEAVFQAHLALIKKANVVMLCSIPFGFGNLKNIEAAEVALEMGKSVLVFDPDNIEERDFTGGEATKQFIALKNKGALMVRNQGEEMLIEALRESVPAKFLEVNRRTFELGKSEMK
jgi:iron complex transport system ATP-binding protein